MAGGGDPTLREEGRERLRLRSADGVQVPYRLALGGNRREPEVSDALQRLAVDRRSAAPLAVPLVEQRELVAENERLERVEAGPVGPPFVLVISALPVLAGG